MNGYRFASFALIFCASLVHANGDGTATALGAESYIHPPKEVEDVVLAPWYKNFSVTNLSPDRTRFIVNISAGMPKISDLGRPYDNLGGLQIDSRANRARALILRRTIAFEIRPLAKGTPVTIVPPKGATISNPEWSPDGKRIAYYAHFDTGTYLYVADAKTGKPKAACPWPVLATLDNDFAWLSDSKRIAAVFVPPKRDPMPEKPAVATAPIVRISDDKPNGLRTYAGLMDTPQQMDLLEWDTKGQLGLADVDSGRVATVGVPAMIDSVSPSPDGNYFRVSVMERPFSYMVPTGSFPRREVIWDGQGKQLVELSKRGLQFGGSDGPTGPTAPAGRDDEKRAIAWRPDGAGLSFLQVVPQARREETPPTGGEEADEQGRGGRGGQGAGTPLPNRRDRVMLWSPPFTEKDIKLVYESENRIGTARYSEDAKTIFLTQTVAGRSLTNAIRLDNPTKVYTVTESRGEDFYNETGALLTRAVAQADPVVRMSSDGKYVYLGGTRNFRDPAKDAPRPFIDKVEIETAKKERVFESSDVRYETATPLDDDLKQLLVTRQSATTIDQTYLVDTATKAETQLTEKRDYAPDLSQATVRTFKVTRNDGLTFQVKVTVPAGTKPGAKLPAFFWFYPSEFVDQTAYDRTLRGANKNLFKTLSSPSNKLILLRQGYALVEPDCPIIGPTDRKNDEYVPQLRNNLAATIDAICEDGMIDRTRLAIGGHSYGAFSTLNAMVHTPFFKAGIAGDGNYNRLLTPFGFQSEQRQLWDSRETYLSMSPLLYLEQMTGAVLLYHSIDDQNLGTDPTNSPRLFQALEALGKNAALYMYPYEDHGPIAQETMLDQWARFVAWLDKWVKNPPAKKANS